LWLSPFFPKLAYEYQTKSSSQIRRDSEKKIQTATKINLSYLGFEPRTLLALRDGIRYMLELMSRVTKVETLLQKLNLESKLFLVRVDILMYFFTMTICNEVAIISNMVVIIIVSTTRCHINLDNSYRGLNLGL
jgi:hypothetical protein